MNARTILPLLLAPALMAQAVESKSPTSAPNSNFQTFIKKLDRAPHFHGRQSRLLAELGGAMLNDGKAEEGEALLKDALRKGKSDIETRYLVGSAYLRHKDTNKAVDAWNPLLRRGPESARTLRQISLELLDAGELAYSERYMERAVALRQDGWVSRAAYASQLLAKGHKDASMRWMGDAVRNDKDKEMASLWLAESMGSEGGKAVLPPDTSHHKASGKPQPKPKAQPKEEAKPQPKEEPKAEAKEAKAPAKPAAKVHHKKVKHHKVHKPQAKADTKQAAKAGEVEEVKAEAPEANPAASAEKPSK